MSRHQKGGHIIAEDTRNLCAQIPVALHARVRREQEASGKTLSGYMTWLITKFYEGGDTPMEGKQRTVAFQVPEELFQRFKTYLREQGMKQNAFFLDCIRRALDGQGQEQQQI